MGDQATSRAVLSSYFQRIEALPSRSRSVSPVGVIRSTRQFVASRHQTRSSVRSPSSRATPPNVEPPSGTSSAPCARTSPDQPVSFDASIRFARAAALMSVSEAGSSRSTVGGAQTASASSATTSQRAAGTICTTYVAGPSGPTGPMGYDLQRERGYHGAMRQVLLLP